MIRGRRLTAGDRIGRWTVVRPAGFRMQSGKNRARCVVRCVCGAERVAFEYMLKAGKTTGCRSRRCRRRWAGASAIGHQQHLTFPEAARPAGHVTPCASSEGSTAGAS